MLLKISLFLAFIVYASEANPNKPGCDLVGSSSNSNVMTRGTIMGQSPTTASNLISFDTNTYNQGDAKITVKIAANSIDTIYLTNIQGESGATGSWKGAISLKYIDNSGAVVTTTTTTVDYVDTGGVNDGNNLKVNQFNHGMYSSTNKVVLNNIKSDRPSSTLTANLIRSETSTISVASTLPFQTFEGIEVNTNTNYIGYVKIGNEVIGYSNVTANGLSIAASPYGRGVEGIPIIHDIGDTVEKYELNGVSLRRICIDSGKQISSNDIGLDHYHIGFDSTMEPNRSADATFGGVK